MTETNTTDPTGGPESPSVASESTNAPRTDSERHHTIKGRTEPLKRIDGYTRSKAIKLFCTECMGYGNPDAPVRPESAERWQALAAEEGIEIVTGLDSDGKPLENEGCVSFTCPLYPYKGWSMKANEGR